MSMTEASKSKEKRKRKSRFLKSYKTYRIFSKSERFERSWKSTTSLSEKDPRDQRVKFLFFRTERNHFLCDFEFILNYKHSIRYKLSISVNSILKYPIFVPRRNYKIKKVVKVVRITFFSLVSRYYCSPSKVLKVLNF